MTQDKERIIFEKAAMLEPNALDEMVHEAKAAEAADINNSGVEAQVGYLMQSYSPQELEQTIDDLLAELEDEDENRSPA
jgi:hypothetical protein